MPSEDEIYNIKKQVSKWSVSFSQTSHVASHDSHIWEASDKVVILGISVIGLEGSSFFDDVSDEEEIQ